MVARLVSVAVGIALDVAASARKASDGGKKVTPDEKRAIIEHAVARLVGTLDELL